jgi:hypothetical protein
MILSVLKPIRKECALSFKNEKPYDFFKDPKGGAEIYKNTLVDFYIFMKRKNIITKHH